MYHIFCFSPLVEILTKNILPLFPYLFHVSSCWFIQFLIYTNSFERAGGRGLISGTNKTRQSIILNNHYQLRIKIYVKEQDNEHK